MAHDSLPICEISAALLSDDFATISPTQEGTIEEKKTKIPIICKTRHATKLSGERTEGKRSEKDATGQTAGKTIVKAFRKNSGCGNGKEKIAKKILGDEKAAKQERKPEEKKTSEGRRRKSSNVGQAGNDRSSTDPPTLEAHVEAIHERRKSLPRTILIDSTTEVEMVIGDDGKPYFQPTVTPKTEEIFEEFAGILLQEEDKSGGEIS
ncbi:hypothetical protein KIN20_037570 [Parelaphostrongylus tenuis]|uniref:Uncharacterized protein n=1 Tax=Parelaphostrongylus tenuis TaxID=148309 RepID=A0AAD5RE56_PARTN|nr:hypothetical protein KIN20_037570 [Parelaphostrongylus tenuis]